MRFGVKLPQSGPQASPEAIAQTAQQAERLGFDSVFVFDRLLYPTNPRTPYPGSPDGKLPEGTRRLYEPLTALTYVAALTKRVRLGTGVLVSAFRSPALLARCAISLDSLSGGRFICGLGLGWSEDEYLASGVGFDHKGARFDEYLEALRSAFEAERNSFKGEYYEVPENLMGLRPVQNPLPIWIGGDSDAALQRAARAGNGWYGHGYMSDEQLRAICERLRALSGGKPFDIALWSPFGFSEKPRMGLVGPASHMKSVLDQYAAAGVTDVILWGGSPELSAELERFATEVMPAVAAKG